MGVIAPDVRTAAEARAMVGSAPEKEPERARPRAARTGSDILAGTAGPGSLQSH